MDITRKQKFINFIQFLDDDQLIGVYSLDKMMNIIHYSIYEPADRSILIEKLSALNDRLDDDFIKVVLWMSSESKEYLIGVYDGLVNEQNTTEME